MTLTQIPNHSEIAVGRLLQQFRGKPRLEGWLRAYIDEVQELEDMWFDVLLSRWLDNAVGAQLDVIGRIVERERLGLEDDKYRVVLRAWIHANRAEGTGDDILDVFSIANPNKNDVEFIPYYPAAFVLEMADALTDNVDLLAELAAKARAGGVRGFIHYTLVDDDDTFTFASGDEAEDSDRQGFSDDLLDNGGFDQWISGNPAYWIVAGESPPNAEVSQVGPTEGHGGSGVGAANIYSADTTYISLRQGFQVGTGETYTVRFAITNHVAGSLNAYVSRYVDREYDTAGEYEFQFQYTGQDGTWYLYFRNHYEPIDVTIDRVSIEADGVGVTGGSFADVVEA